MRWELVIDTIETNICIGICEHEQNKSQRLLVSMCIWANYPAKPKSIDECVDYGLVHDLVTHQWPKRPQVQLMESLASELLEFVFRHSPAIDEVEVELSKPEVFDNVKGVGIKAKLTREQFKAL